MRRVNNRPSTKFVRGDERNANRFFSARVRAHFKTRRTL